VSDIDTAVVDSLKALDPDGRLEKRTKAGLKSRNAAIACRATRVLPRLGGKREQ
jgi:hypothetical protein